MWGSGCRWLFPKGVNFALFLSYFYSEARSGSGGRSVIGGAYAIVKLRESAVKDHRYNLQGWKVRVEVKLVIAGMEDNVVEGRMR